MRTAFTMAARYLWGRKLRTFLTTLAVAFGVMILFGFNAYIPAFTEAFRTNLLAAAGKADLTVTSKTNATFGTDVLNTVAHVDGVAHATGMLSQNVVLPLGGPVDQVAVNGIDPTDSQLVHPLTLAQGRLLTTGDSNSMLVSGGLATKAGLHVGDRFSVPSAAGSTAFRVVGIVSVPAVGLEQTYVPLRAVQALFSQAGKLNDVEASFRPDASAAEILRIVKLRLGPKYTINGIDNGSQLFASLQLGQAAINMFGFFALAMAGFIIFNTFRTIVSERKRDLGMLRTIGASRGAVIGIVGAESLLQGVVGTAVGLFLGWLIAEGLLTAMGPIFEQYIRISIGGPVFTASNWVMSISLGIGVTLLGGLWPAVQASRTTPLAALRPATAEVDRASYRRRGYVGLALVAAAVATLATGDPGLTSSGSLLFIVGLVIGVPALVRPVVRLSERALSLAFAGEGELAGANLERQPARAGVTVSAMMISLAIVVGLLGVMTSLSGGFIGYLDKSLGADFLLIPQSIVLGSGNVGAGPALAREVRSTPGIGVVTTLRVAQSQTKGTAVQVLGIDPETYRQVSGLQFSKGDASAAYDQLAAGRNVIVNGIFASQKNVKVDDVLTLGTPEGDKQYRVVAIGTDYLTAKLLNVFISQKNLAQDFHATSDLLVMANARPGASISRVHTDLARIVKGFPSFTLFEAAQWRETQVLVFNQVFAGLYILVALLAIPSLLALVNTLAINVLERTRELGMMRAVGSTRGQVRRMILGESLLLSALGTGLGLLAGLWLGYALVIAMNSSGFVFAYYFPWSAIVAGAAVGILVGVTASVLPARQAARLDIVKALQYE